LAEQNAGSLDTLIKVWAVLGPLIAATVSTMWSRHIQNSDRQFDLEREKEREAKERDKREQEYERQLRLKKYEELKAALADCMSSSYEYVKKQSEYITNPLPERHQTATAANDKFVYSSQLVTLLGNDELAGKVIEFWNATIAIPKSYNIQIDRNYEEKLCVYRRCRAEFNEAARSYLIELEEGPRPPTSE